ncbi:hypothetical protein ZC03_068 [Pseudomonas phage ZC03]|uniref:DUF2591 domain-containing protein n=2 Tax=Zicotriavirus TaxID=2843161 RepID=A0A1L2C9C4_9CAUD|nr:hypothetical protein HWA93_gp61 [Pseudomonas phage ZC03]YP_009830625.1 hypothetical protein HWA94_gp63 [Pseudomonas phage ZC08]AMD43445.1 hypothetical protein ZC03_068 [Pseudomonas phage ZC03]AMD43502.1 hypothetical protein ZC08_063 [Pseudomonas phage ZC08]
MGSALDWAVIVAEHGKHDANNLSHIEHFKNIREGHSLHQQAHYSTNWSHGGPIIEREGIAIREIHPVSGENGYIFTRRWIAEMFRFPGGPRKAVAYGTTPLISAMRCYVTSRLGNEVEIPEELLG